LILNDGSSNYIYGPGKLPVEQISNEGVVSYIHHDQQGSSRLITGSTGVVEGTTTYDAFGNVLGATGTKTTALGFDGQYTSADTGLIYMRARTYDPATAQYLTVDPIVPFTRAPYAYASDNPTTYTDPTGLVFGIPGTPSFSEVGHALSTTFGDPLRDAEYVAAGACVVASAGTCLAATGAAFALNTGANIGSASSVGDFAGKELFTVGETAVGGAPGLLVAVPEQLGVFALAGEDGGTLLPQTWLGKALLNLPPGLAAIAVTSLEPQILAELGECEA
jgi:RHS repeat-associated protein